MLFFLKRAGYFVRDNWKIVIPVILVVIILLWVLWSFACGKKKASIDLEAVNKINSQNRAEREKALQDVIEKNQEIIKTVDNRSNVAEVNAIERNRAIDEKVKEADRKIQEAKQQQGGDVTAEQLDCLLIPENCP